MTLDRSTIGGLLDLEPVEKVGDDVADGGEVLLHGVLGGVARKRFFKAFTQIIRYRVQITAMSAYSRVSMSRTMWRAPLV